MSYSGHKVHIGPWAVWAPISGVQQLCSPKRCEEKDKPDLSFLPLVLRKRLSLQSKAALWLSNEVVGLSDKEIVRQELQTVFATRYGEYDRTYSILNDILEGEPLSPAAFSSSVHNTAAGLWTIACQSLSPSTTVSAGELTLFAGVLEASLQAESCGGPVLFHYSDVPLPAVYQRWSCVSQPVAISALVYPEAAAKLGGIDIDFETLKASGLLASFYELHAQLQKGGAVSV